MKTFKFETEQMNGRWVIVCTSHEHFPMIEKLKTGEYKVKGADGKPRIEKEYKAAMKFAKETFKRMAKINAKFDKLEKFTNSKKDK